jgi:integrase
MASAIRDRSGNYLVKFRWGKREFTKSLHTKEETVADLGVARVNDALMRLKRGLLEMPPEAEPGEFIVSGGTLTAKPKPADRIKPLTLGELFNLYVESVPKEPNTLRTIRIHQNHIEKVLRTDTPVESITLEHVQRYCDRRAKMVYHGQRIRPYTIRKELRTFRQTWLWGFRRGHVGFAPSWEIPVLDLQKDEGREPFRTFAEIERRINRGGLPDTTIKRLWECLYLDGEEVKACLEYVQHHAIAPFVFPMIAFVALTGCRRAEMLRSEIEDWDFDNRIVHIRERKRDTSKKFTMRSIDLHPYLVNVMRAWFDAHPGGQYTISQGEGPLTESQATDHLNRTLAEHDKWCHIPGFHTFRHSFASILASKGVDQRIIDRYMGHQTEEMRKRYQHLFPQTLRRAIDELLP